MVSKEFLSKLPKYDITYMSRLSAFLWKELKFNSISAVDSDAAVSAFRYALLSFMSASGISDPEANYETDIRIKKVSLQ